MSIPFNANDNHSLYQGSLAGVSDGELRALALQLAKLGTSLRTQDSSVHLRKLRKIRKIQQEKERVISGSVKKWCSEHALREHSQQAKHYDSCLSKQCLVADNSRAFSMKDIVVKSKENSVWEALERGNALNKICKENNWKAASITLTCPAFMHHSSRNWDGSTPIEQQRHLQKCFVKFRSALSALGIEEGDDWLALKAAEPHLDGTVHWHLCVIASMKNMKVISELLRKYYLEEHHPEERGARQRRVKFEVAKDGEDSKKITAYAAKFALISNLPEVLHKTEEHVNNARRYAAWRKRWGIRGFSFCGLAPVGLWRECRSRYYDSNEEMNLVKYAQAGDYFKFHMEWKKLGGHDKIQSIHEEHINKYSEKIKRCIGHFIKASAEIIALKVRNAVIKTINTAKSLVTLIVNEPSRHKQTGKSEILRQKGIEEDEIPF